MMQYQHHQQQQYSNTEYSFDQYDQYQMAPLNESRHQMPNNSEYMSSNAMCQVPAIESADESDSPVLRALLNNKTGKRLTPSYTQSPPAKRQRIQFTENNRTEESLEYFDDFTFEKQQPIKDESGYVYGAMPLGMTSENLIASSSIPSASTTPLTNHTVNSPIANYVITPPQSPKEAAIEHVNQTSNICDASSRSECQNGSDGKCRITIFSCFIFIQLPELFEEPIFSISSSISYS